MKTLTLTIGLAICLISNIIAKNKIEKDSMHCLNMQGEILFNDRPLQNAIITVYEFNDSITAVNTNKKGKFNLKLDRNKIYSVLIEEEGVFHKLITINTVISQNDEDYDMVWKFSCSISMNKRIKKFHNEDALDFPYAIIYFNEAEDNFTFDKKYTMKIQKEISKTMEKLTLQNTMANIDNGQIKKLSAEEIQRQIISQP